MKWNSIIILFTACCLLLPGLSPAQDSQSYEVSVTTITVWVKAVDGDGKPVEGLTQADFEVTEDKHPVELNCFEEVKQTREVSAPGGSAEPDEFKQKFAIYLDLFNTTPDELSAIRPRLKDFLTRISTRRPEVMLAALMPNRKLGIISPFTADLGQIKAKLDKAPGNSKRDVAAIARRDQMIKTMEGAGDDLVDVLRDAYRQADSFAEEEEQRSRFTLAALESFASHLATLNFGDHVVVIYISGGFSSDPGRQYYDIVDSLATDSVAMEDVHALTFHRRPNFDFDKELQKSIGRMNRYNVTISTLDTQGMESNNEYRDSLVRMAQETGGIALSGSRNFKEGLNNILDDLEQSYILCYSPPPHAKPGEYHTIKVSCKRPGVKVRHRDGYVD